MDTVVRKSSLPSAVPVAASTPAVTRHITPEAGHAIEKLAHAIDYLTDEIVHRHDPLANQSPEVEAVQILMKLNRRIYDECPPRCSIVDRVRHLFQRMAHPSLRAHPRR